MPDPSERPQMEMPPEDAEGGMPAMSPEEAMQVIQSMKIPPDMLPQLSMAIDVLEDAGMLPGGEVGEMPPQRGHLDAAIDAAKAKVMGGDQAAPY